GLVIKEQVRRVQRADCPIELPEDHIGGSSVKHNVAAVPADGIHFGGAVGRRCVRSIAMTDKGILARCPIEHYHATLRDPVRRQTYDLRSRAVVNDVPPVPADDWPT